MTKRFVTAHAAYTEVENLRERATGSTYVVQRESDGAHFILKELNIGKLEGWKQFDLFEREIAAVRSIDHPRIPDFVDSHLDEEAGRFVLVQTRIEGTTLRDMMRGHEVLSPQQTEHYLRQALELLEVLHGGSPPVIHRDITPSNVIIRNGELYLIDFGAVKVGTAESTSMTTVGTFGYMAPEQILGRATTASDLYGLGMTFVAMATGMEPSDLPQDPNSGRIDPSGVLQVPPHLHRTLLALIRPGLGERPKSAREALALLDPGYNPMPQLAPGPYVMPAQPMIYTNRVSPYKAPEALTEPDKAYLRQHSLRSFPVWAAVMLHYLTFGLFSIIHMGMQHERFPEAMPNDPSAGKAIGFSFIPYFNLYWCVFAPLRLADRINLQSRLRGDGDAINRELILVSGIFGVIPYLNILIGIPFWGIGVYKLQKAINALAEQAEAERAEQAALSSGGPPGPPPALGPTTSPAA